jgi:hypothetical protein
VVACCKRAMAHRDGSIIFELFEYGYNDGRGGLLSNTGLAFLALRVGAKNAPTKLLCNSVNQMVSSGF